MTRTRSRSLVRMVDHLGEPARPARAFFSVTLTGDGPHPSTVFLADRTAVVCRSLLYIGAHMMTKACAASPVGCSVMRINTTLSVPNGTTQIPRFGS